MTTQSWSTVVDHTSDAAFRTWGLELNTKLGAAGALQTADTGQINWSTVVRGSANTAAGYEIWKLPTGNLYFKIEYGTASTSNPALWVTIGTGSNGSGTLTGQLSTRSGLGMTNGTSLNSTTTNYTSYLCVTNSFVGLAWKCGNSANRGDSPVAMFSAGLTVDSTGTPTSVGYYFGAQVYVASASSYYYIQSVRTAATAQSRSQTNGYCCIPGQPASSSDGTNNQAYLHWLDMPGVQAALFSCTVRRGEVLQGNTFSAALVGTTPHTYICIQNSPSTWWTGLTDVTQLGNPCILWE